MEDPQEMNLGSVVQDSHIERQDVAEGEETMAMEEVAETKEDHREQQGLEEVQMTKAMDRS